MRYDDTRTMTGLMMKMGLGLETSMMIVPTTFMTPATTDQASPPVMRLVKGIQCYLNKHGWSLDESGYIDDATKKALHRVVGPRWQYVTWGQVVTQLVGKKVARPASTEDTMGYLGLGLVDYPGWCSDKNPQGTCKRLYGVCKPMTIPVLNLFKSLQTQLNRIAHVKGYGKIEVDGRIGSKTVALVNKALDQSHGSCDSVAQMSDQLATKAMSLANSLNAPTTVPVPVAKAPSMPAPDGTTVINPSPAFDLGRIRAFMATPLGLLLIGGGVFWFLKSREKK